MFDRAFATLFFTVAAVAGIGAVLLLFFNFLDWLTTGRFEHPTLLELGYDTHVIKARWFLAHKWSWGIHDVLERIPVGVALIAAAPIAWWAGLRISRR